MSVSYTHLPLILPLTKGNVVKTFIIGFVVLAIGLYFVTDLAPYFTKAAHDVYAKTQEMCIRDSILIIPTASSIVNPSGYPTHYLSV